MFGPNPLFKGSDVEHCFGVDLYPPPPPIIDPPLDEDILFGHDYDSDDSEIWEMLQGRDPYD